MSEGDSSMESKAKTYKIMVDNKPCDWDSQFITGKDIKQLAGVKIEYGVWLKIPGPDPDVEVRDDERIDLEGPGREKFFTGPKQTTEGK
jgi:hypothetical protein